MRGTKVIVLNTYIAGYSMIATGITPKEAYEGLKKQCDNLNIGQDFLKDYIVEGDIEVYELHVGDSARHGASETPLWDTFIKELQ